jgi:glycolate oxidase iron-sulfur subunit
MMPNVNSATARVLDAAGIQTVVADGAGCCGAIRLHLDDEAGALAQMRRNIDAWWPLVEGLGGQPRVEAIVMNASGCGVTVKEYAHALARDPAYTAKAQRIAALTKDVGELLPELGPALKSRLGTRRPRIAFHAPCSLQHGQRLAGLVERELAAIGVDVQVAPSEAHLCCGSAGTYSVLQPELAHRLRDRKLAQLTPLGADVIASANVGCIQHLQSGTTTAVRHWVEVLDQVLDL